MNLVGEQETDRERFLRRAAEARAFVERVNPALLQGAADVDQTLLDWTLSMTLRERFDAAVDHQRQVDRLNGLARVSSEDR